MAAIEPEVGAEMVASRPFMSALEGAEPVTLEYRGRRGDDYVVEAWWHAVSLGEFLLDRLPEGDWQ